jgi:hypothetical protein
MGRVVAEYAVAAMLVADATVLAYRQHCPSMPLHNYSDLWCWIHWVAMVRNFQDVVSGIRIWVHAALCGFVVITCCINGQIPLTFHHKALSASIKLASSCIKSCIKSVTNLFHVTRQGSHPLCCHLPFDDDHAATCNYIRWAVAYSALSSSSSWPADPLEFEPSTLIHGSHTSCHPSCCHLPLHQMGSCLLCLEQFVQLSS